MRSNQTMDRSRKRQRNLRDVIIIWTGMLAVVAFFWILVFWGVLAFWSPA